ncbi:MAG: hypothetical protein IKC48_04350 [Clostridia bacterium]|nr:hypothetical protein [Clostridia bacterium]
MKNKNEMIFAIIFFSVAICGLAFGLVFCIIQYSRYDVDYNELTHERLTFIRYEKPANYDVYFEEYAEPFEISNIVHAKLDKEALDELKENQAVDVFYRQDLDGDFTICEMTCDSTTLLSLSDYIKRNQNNQMVGIILCGVMLIMSAVIIWLCGRALVGINKIPSLQKTRIPGSLNGELPGLGKVKIERRIDGYVIRIYNSFEVCSLVINNQIKDQFWGVMGEPFSLISTVLVNGKKVVVEAKMGLVNMRLYYDGNLVAKKFFAFG